MQKPLKTQRQTLIDFIAVFRDHPDMQREVAVAEQHLNAINHQTAMTERLNRGKAAALVRGLLEEALDGEEFSEKESHIIGLVAKGMSDG